MNNYYLQIRKMRLVVKQIPSMVLWKPEICAHGTKRKMCECRFTNMQMHVHMHTHVCAHTHVWRHVHSSYKLGISPWTRSFFMTGTESSQPCSSTVWQQKFRFHFCNRISVTVLQHLKFTLGFCHIIHHRERLTNLMLQGPTLITSKSRKNIFLML